MDSLQRTKIERVLLALCQVLFVVSAFGILFPDHFYLDAQNGLDSSWRLALHDAFHHGKIWGREIVFTYGPLGVLSSRIFDPALFVSYLAMDMFLMGNILFILAAIVRKLTTFPQILTAAAVVLQMGWILPYLDLVIGLLFIEIFHLFVWWERGRVVHLVVAVAAAAVAFFIKLNMGLVTVAILALVMIANAIETKRILPTVGALIGFGVCILVGAWVLPVNIPHYLVNSLPIISGFNDGMFVTFEVRQHFLILAVVAVGVLALGVLANIRSFFSLRMFALGSVCAVTLYLLFKQGFVRADGHELAFFNYAPLVLSLLFLFGDTRVRVLAQPAIVTMVAVGLSMMAPHYTKGYFQGQFESFTQGYWAQLNETLQARNDPTMHPLKPDGELPEGALPLLRSGGVDVMPWELSVIFKNGLTYSPRPVIQSYSVYRPELEALNAAHFHSSNAPEHILYNIECVDGRYCFSEETRSKLALFERYALMEQPIGRFIGLALEVISKKSKVVSDSEKCIKLGEWISVPLERSSESLVLLSGKAHYSIVGKLRSFLYKPAELRMTLDLANGEQHDYRMVRGMLESGLIVSRAVEDVVQVRNYFAGLWGQLPKVNRVRIYSSSSFGYAQDMCVKFDQYSVVKESDTTAP